MKLRVATFNVENLMSTLPAYGEDGVARLEGPLRFLKRDRLEHADALGEAFHLIEAHEQRKLTALVIAALDAHVVCLQEVESEPVLRQFRNAYLDPITGGAYKHLRLVEGNDGRGIDVAFLSRLPLENVRNHGETRFADVPGAFTEELARTVDRYKRERGEASRMRYPAPEDFVFRRGLLCADVTVGAATVSIYTAHLKSSGSNLEPTFATSRAYTAPLRRAEALAVRHLVEERFGARRGEALYVICGDLNDAAFRNGEPWPRDDLSIAPLVDPAFATNLIEDLPPIERWTHWWGDEGAFAQLDYVLASPALRRANPATAPLIERRGMAWRVPWRPARPPAAATAPRWVTGALDPAGALALACEGLERFPGVGFDTPRASDHAALAVTLEVPGGEQIGNSE